MIYPVDRIKQDVRICMDENRTTDSLFADGDVETLKLDEVIESKILEAVKRVHLAAPYWLLEQGHNFEDEADAVYWGDLESGWVHLPSDFLRLVVFEMSDWERPVYKAISMEDPLYARQRSRVKALRGTAERPVCAIGVRPEGKVLEFYSCKSDDAVVTKAVYIPYPEVDEMGGVDISERCYDAVVYMTAGLALTGVGEAEKAAVLFDKAKTLIEQ